MLSFQAAPYLVPCGTLSGGISEIFWFDPDDLDWTSDSNTTDLVYPPYKAVALRDGVTLTDGGGLFPIDIDEETGNFKATQSINGRHIKWEYDLKADLVRVDNNLTNFFARLDAASICSNIGVVIVDNNNTINVIAERWVNGQPIPKFRMKNDGSEIEIGSKLEDKNGGLLSLKGSYNRGPIEFTGGRAALEAVINKNVVKTGYGSNTVINGTP